MHLAMVLASVAVWLALLVYWNIAAARRNPSASLPERFGRQRRCPVCSHTAPTEDRGIVIARGSGQAAMVRRCPVCRKLRLYVLENPAVEGAPAPADTAHGPGAPAPEPLRSAESPRSRAVHQMIFKVALLLALVPRIPLLDRRFLPEAWYAASAAGLALQVASVAFYFWAMSHLGRHWSGEVRIKDDHRLVRTGPYRVLRHPMYTAIIGMFAGTALVWGEWHGLLAVLAIVVAYWRKIRIEDRHLASAFGEEYEGYRRGSWALIPGML